LVLDRAPYDAALLGWASLTHVLEEPNQDALFEALTELVPHGPILASFFLRSRFGAVPALDGRAHRLGQRLGSAMRQIAPVSNRSEHIDDRVRFTSFAGFVYDFDRERLEHLAALCKRTLTLYADNTYPHATFR
jgi:hypothetical protein